MKKNILIIILSLLILGLSSFIICDKLIKESKDITNSETSIEEKIEVYSYYTEESGEHSLKLNKDNKTYEMELNVCAGILNVSGIYEIIDNKLILKEINHNSNQPFELPTNVEFIIENNTKLVLNQNFSCVYKGQVFNLK